MWYFKVKARDSQCWIYSDGWWQMFVHTINLLSCVCGRNCSAVASIFSVGCCYSNKSALTNHVRRTYSDGLLYLRNYIEITHIHTILICIIDGYSKSKYASLKEWVAI